LLGGNISELPHPDTNWKGFSGLLKTLNAKPPGTWCPVELTSQPWFLLDKLKKKYKKKSSVFGFI
jgi:hypothetical protein